MFASPTCYVVHQIAVFVAQPGSYLRSMALNPLNRIFGSGKARTGSDRARELLTPDRIIDLLSKSPEIEAQVQRERLAEREERRRLRAEIDGKQAEAGE